MRWMNKLVNRSGMTTLLAATIFMVGGGVGVAVALSTSSAGAATAHSSLPPVNVSVGNTPTVNVGNLPTNGTGRLKVENGSGSSHETAWGPWMNVSPSQAGQVLTMTNVSGSGTFEGMQLADSAPGGSCGYIGDVWIQVTIDGNQAFGSWLTWIGNYWSSGGGSAASNAGVIGGTDPCQGNGPWYSMHYFPQQPLPYSHSLVVTLTPYPNGVENQLWATSFYTTNG